MTRPRRFRPA